MADDPKNNDDLSQRLDKLKSKLDSPETRAIEGAHGAKGEQQNDSQGRAGVGQAFRLSSEFIAGVVVGAGIGYLIDEFFGTRPWGMIIFLMLGFAAAVLNILRSAGMVAESEIRLKSAEKLANEQHDTGTDGGSQK